MNNQILKLYSAFAFSLILISALLAYDSLTLKTFAQILSACSCLCGFVFFVNGIFKKPGITLAIIAISLVLLPLIPIFKYVIWSLALVGFLNLIKTQSKFNALQFYPLPILILVILASSIYTDFQYTNRLVSGKIPLDTLFHADVAAMYLHYGIPSVGLNGLIPILYHTFSHKIMAGVSVLSGFETLATYSYIYFSLAPLLLIFSLANLTCKINPKLSFYQSLLGISLVFLSIILFKIFKAVALWDSWFGSESFLFSLVFMTFSISSLIDFEKNKQYRDLILALLLLVLAALTKGSVGILGLAMFWFLALTRFRAARYVSLVVISTFIIYFAMHSVAGNAQQNILISPFSFVKRYVNVPLISYLPFKLIIFLTFHFIFLWSCFYIGFRRFSYAYIRTMEFQILFGLFLPAIAIALTFDIAGGSIYYFSSVPVLVAIIFFNDKISMLLSNVKIIHIIIILIIGLFLLHPLVFNRTGIAKKADTKLVNIVSQLQSIRDDSAPVSIVKVTNSEILYNLIGCKAYWMIPAVMERAVIEGMPNLNLCPEFSSDYKGTYGLSEYQGDIKHDIVHGIINLKLEK